VNVFSPDKRYLALGGHSPAILEAASEKLTTFVPFPGGPAWYVEEYHWHPDSQWLYSAENLSFAGGGGSLEGICMLKADGSVRRELTVIEISPTGINWLPDRVIPYLAPASQP
jgi:hypothetical protein